jgi:hypothetical protein
MHQVFAEELLCLVIGAKAAERCHDSGIIMHPAKLVQILDTLAFRDQAVCAKSDDGFHTCQIAILCSATTHWSLY